MAGVDPVRSRPAQSAATTALGRSTSNGVDFLALSDTLDKHFVKRIYFPLVCPKKHTNQRVVNVLAATGFSNG